jgi:hypothetical protein
MRNFRLSIILAALVALSWCAAPARAAGYWNTPSTFCQCMGCGWGAGYHAPLVLGPIKWRGWCAPNEIRLPYPPAPAYGCCGNGGCGSYGPSRLDADLVRPPVSAPAPVSTVFASPIEP